MAETRYDALVAVLQDEFALRKGEEPERFIRSLGAQMRALEDALESDTYTCPECGTGTIRAMVLDALVGAVYIEGTCCLVDDARIAAAALERGRLRDLLQLEAEEVTSDG